MTARIRGFRLLALAVGGCLAAAVVPAAAQDWDLQVLMAPELPPYVHQLNTQHGLLQIIVTRTGSGLAGYEVRTRLRSSSGQEARSVTHPLFFSGPGVRVLTNTSPELVDRSRTDVPPAWEEMAVRGGIIPQDRYELCAAIYVEGQAVTDARCTWVYVDAAPPPVLILPTDGALMTDSWVIFSWAPTLSLTMSSLQNYYLRLAEVRTGQTLSEAIASSPYHEALVTGRSQYVYPVGALPLRPGQAYAWQVQALDTEGRPLGTNAGRSEIRSFAYLPDSGPDAMLAEIPLVSDLAVLTGLHTATVKPWADGFMVDGLAVLRFALPGGPVQVGARAEDLTISLTGGLAVTGGAVEAVGTLDGLVPPGLSDLLSVHRVRWTHREGLLAEATLRAPGDRVLARGDLAFGPMGLFGTIEATGTSERPLLEVGSGPLTLRITRVAAALPQGDVRAEGQLTLAGKPLPCTLEDFDLSSAGSQLSVRCTPEEGAVSVIAGSTRLGLRVDALTGQLAIDWTTASLDYDLALEGGVELALAGDAAGPCGASMTLGLIPASPIRVRASRFDCDVPNPTLDLGVARATLRDVRLTSLDHTPEGWDFRVRLDAELAFPGLGVHSLPLIRGIELEPQGITFPALAWTEEELVTAGAGSAFVAGFEIRPYGLRLAPFTFPWFQWAGEGAGGWDVELDLELGLPLLPMATASCLRGASLRIHGARFSDGHFFGTLQPRTLETACNLPLGPAAGLRLTAVDGSLSGAYADGRIALSGFLGVAGEMELAEPFLCPVGATMATPALAQGSLALHPDGRLEGEVTGLAPPCGFTWGALTASLSDAWLRFGMEDGHPTARMGAAMQATLDLASAEITEVAPTAETSPITVTGRLAYDFLEGRLVALEGQIPGPVEIGLPFHDPVLRFRLASAELSPRGLVVNGNQELLLGPATGAVSFHDLVVDLEDASVVDGSATIQGGLALEAEIQPSLGLWFRARPPGSRLTAEMGALLSLMGDVVLDHQGLAVTGSADAELAYAGTALDDLGTVFSDDFTFGLSPFGVRTGWADLEYQQQRVARVDPDGIHPDMAFFGTLFTGFIPDELPLPTLQTAFLQLRGPGGELRVVATEAEDGSVRLDTPIDETLDLVLPALQGTQPQPPSVALTIRDLRVDPSSFAVTAGTVAAELSAPWDLRTMGIPLVLERLAYVPASGNPDRGGLDLQGLLTLFDEVIDEVPVALRIGPDNRIRGDIALSGLDLDLASIDAVTLRLTSLEGSVDLPAEAPLTGSYSMDAAVEMSVASGRGASLEADVGLRLTESGLQVTAFEAAARGPEADCADFSFQYLAACVRQLRDLEASRDQDGRLRFDVGVDLRLAFRMGSDRWLSVELEDARLRDSGFRLPATELALGGNQQPAPALELGPATLRLTGITLPAVELDWSGERVDASVSDPTLSLELAWAGETAVGSGTVTLTSAGLSGEVVAEGPNGETLLSLGEWGDPIRLDLTRLTARFPQYSISAAGRLRFIGDPIPCTVEHLDLLRATATADVACTFDHEIPLIPGSDRMTLAVRTLSGSLQLPWQSAAPSYSMELSADVKLALTTEHRCGAGLLLSASDTGGLTVTDSEFSCSIPEPRLDLGFVRIAPRDVTLDRFEYGPDAAWDFSLSLDADVSFPHLGGYELPTLEGVVLDTAGFHFPGVALEPEDLPSLLADGPDASMDGFGLRVNGFRMDPFTFPWFNWQAGAGPWSFALDFDLTLPGLPASAPTCLRDAVFHVRNATFADSELSAALPISLMEDPGCPLPIGAGATLHLRELGGWLSGAYTAENGLALDGGLALSSDLELGEPFLCPPSTGRMTLAEAQLFLTSAGMVTGLIENLAPPCPLQLGPVQAAFADAWLSFNADENGQVARIGAEAGIALDLMVDTVTATGMLVYDLTAAAMEELDLRLHGPFELGIPFDDPALTFRFDSAQLAGPRLRIEGHHHLVLGSTTLGATFNDFQLDLDALEVVEGSVTFDAAFAFEAGITPDHVLTLEAVPLHTIMTADPGALLELSGQVTIDEDGLRSTGGAAAKLRFGEQRLDDLALDLSEDFRIGFAPFGVRAGHADLLWHDDAVARIDSRGFHPQVAFFLSHVLPARLPLPTTNVAYLMLRDADGDLLLDMEWNDGGLVLSTWPGQTVDLVMPALQRPGDAAPPAIGVAFSGFEIHPQDFSVLAGEILVALPEAWDLSELGIPLALDTVRYARRDDGDGTLTGLFLEGPLVLLESDLGADGRVRLHVDGTERLKGSIELNDVGYPVDVAGPVRVWVDALRGTLEVPLGNAIGLPDIFFHVAGRFEVGNGTGLAAAADIEATYGNTDGFQVRSFAASGSGDGCALVDFGAVAFCVDGIRSLRFSHHTQTGFDFGAELDLVITVRPMGADSLQFALMGVEVRPQGFHIPSQTLNASSRPALNGPAIQVAGASLRLLEARFPALTVGWAGEWTGVQVADTFPSFDFELKLPSFQQNAPSLANAPITLQNVAFHAQNRVLTGQILPYTFPDDGARLPLGGSLAVYIQEIAGGLVADAGPDGPRQGVDLQVSGAIALPEAFGDDAGELRTLGAATLSVSTSGGVSGTITDFGALGSLSLGPISLTPQLGSLHFAFAEGVQEVTLEAGATLALPPPSEGLDTVNVEGAVVLDLVAGRLLDGSISIAQPFSWPFPFRAEEPLFLFTVSQAVLDTTGLRFTGGGSMRVGEGQVGVDFRNFRFGLPGLVPESGSVQIQSAFALELDLGPMDGNGNGNGNGSASRWAVRDPATPFDAETALRLVVPERVSLSSQGLTVNGTSGAALNFGGESFAALALEFDGFTLQPDPVRLAEGRADFYLVQPDDTTHVGWYDTGGFGLSPEMTSLLLAQVPDTLGLPSKDVAYLVLRDPVTRSPLVTSERRDGQTTFSATGLPLVLAGLSNGDGSHPTVTVEGSLTLDDAWSPVAGSIEANLEDAPLAVPGVPLSVTRFKFQNHGAEYALIADARLEIPGLDMPDLVATGLTFGPGGFVAGEFAMGSCQDPYMPGGESFVEGSFGDGALSLAVNAVEVTFRADGSRTICFTAGLASSILGESNGAPSSVGLGASHTIHGWDFALDVSHLPNQGKVPLGVAEFEPEANGIRAEVGWDDDQEYFEVQLRGLLHLDELMDDEFAIAVDTLAFGTRGFRAFARHEATRELHLFGGYLPLELTSLTVGIVSEGTTPVLTVAMDAKGQFLGRDIAVKGLVLGSDGTFALDSAGVNLLSEPLEIFGEHLRLTQMALLFSDSDMGIRASGEALVPAPLNSMGNVTLTVSRDHSGNWDHHASARFDFEQPSTEARIGDFTLDLREAGIDLDPRQPIASRVWAVAELYESEGGAEDRRIRFGRTGQNGTDPGIAFRFNDPGEGIPMDYTDFTIEWNAYQDEGFWFGPGFLQVGVTALGVSNDPRWQLTVDGGARLNLEDRVQGSIAVEGLVIDSTGIAHWGQIAGGDLTVMGAFELSVGKFDYHRGEPIELTLTKVSSDRESAAEYENGTPPVEIVRVTEYLHFAPVSGQNQGIGTCGGMAACLTLGDGIGGGVKELRFFQTAEGAVSLLVDSATLSLPGNMGGHLSLRYEAAGDGGGDDLFRASGRIYRGEDGFGAAGSFGRHKGELTYGLFVAASVPIHIVPGVIVLRGVGGGFFWRPVYEDYKGVLSASNYEPYRSDLWRDDFTFAGFLFGDVSIIEPPTGGVYYLRGKTLLTVTDASLHLDADASLFGLDGNPFLLRSQMYLAAAFTRADLADSARDLSLSAGLGVFVDFGIPLSGRGEADFRIRTGSSGTQWSLTGLAELQMLELYNLDANLWAGNDGLLARLHVERQLDLFILRNKVDFLTNFWWYREDQSIGAYAELNANVAFLGYELAGVGFQGALLRDPPDDLLYFAGRAFVDVAVYSGEVSFWLALLNGDWSGGRGANPRLEAMIAEAQNRSASITETLTVSPPTSYALSPDELATAGARLYSETKVNRNWWADELLLSNERRIDDPIPSTFQLALDQLVRGTDLQDTPEPDTEVSSSITSLNSETSALDTWFGGVRGQLHRIESILDEQAQVQLQNPLANLVPPVTDDGELRTGLSFWVDGSTAEQTVTQLTDVRAANQAREGEYRQAMGRISNNLLVLDRMMADRSYFQSSAPSVFGSPLAIVDWGLSTIPRASPPDLGVPVDRSISGVSRAYRRALEATSAYKARRIGYHWDRAGWADGSLSWFQGITGQLDSDNVEWTLRSMPDTTRARVFGERYRYLEFFKGVTWPETRTVGEAARELITHDMIEANRAQESRRTLLWTSIYGNFTQSGAQLWRDLHLQGLPVFADTSRARAVTLRTEAVAEQAGLLADHRAFTSAVHGIYSQMADLTSILYAMVDEYLHWRDSWDEGASWQGARPEYVATRQELAKALEPPRLTEIRVKPTRFGSRVENLIIWTATHPLGTAESAIHVQHQATDPASAALVSLGDANDFLQHEARRSPTRITDDYQVFVRARGPAGTTATRSATYTLTVGGTTYLGLSTGLGQVITVADATRPSTPSVAFDYEQTIDPSTGELTYWATDPTRIPMTLSSVDYDSDIAAYEVALGTTSAGTQVRDWAVMQGRRPLANDNPDRANTLLETSLTALDLVDGQTYWVSAKTENGAGRTSAIRAVHLRADLTPPTMPGATTQSEHTQPTGSTSTAVDVATSVPVWADPRVNTREQVAPSVRVLWLRSRDDLSGLKHYEFVATRNPDARHAAFDQGFTISSRTTATLTGPPLSYADSAIWVLVRARDHAGQVSEPTVIPRVVRDWTRPTSPMGHLYFTDTGDARFYITRLAMDPESGILGYQWSIGTEPGLNDLRPWSNPGDLPERRLVSCRRAEGMVWSPELCEDPPYFTIPAADLPPAGRFDGYFVNLRVINNAGILSHGISSGPATIEQQQPQTRMRAP